MSDKKEKYSDEYKKEKFEHFKQSFGLALEEWAITHPGQQPPALWDDKQERYVWVNRANRRRLGVR